MKTLLFSLTLCVGLAAVAAPESSDSNKSLKSEFNTLGDNKAVADRIKKMESQQKIRVVQNRLVDRNNRVELAVNYGYLGGGDSYVQTQNVGGMIQYHITPRWSFGFEYQKAYNSLTQEGRRQFDQAAAAQAQDPNSPQRFPSVDYPLETKLATVSFYPIYGKLNLFDLSVAQFDMYALLGAGKKTMYSGDSDVLAAGLGVGLWLNSWLTTRFEVRYEKYKDLMKTEQRDQNSLDAMASLGIWLW